MSNKNEKIVLAFGADLKSRFLLARGRSFSFGPDIGDLGEAKNFEIFKKEIRKATKLSKPDVFACDLHTGYFSTRLATEYNAKPIQHHHAHIASVIEEHGLTKPILGVSFDGTGLGTDGNIWGGEFLLVGKKGFKRLAHLSYSKMPGGDKVTHEPWRMALGILGKDAKAFLKKPSEKEKDAILAIMAKNINSPLTSSAGRLFDAASAILGVCEYASFEAEGPIKLEKMCKEHIEDFYKFKLMKKEGQHIIDTKSVFQSMINDIKNKKEKSLIATKFHNSIAKIIKDTVRKLSKDTKIKDVALSGGVFQNKYLLKKTTKDLISSGFNVFTNEKNPVNDLNIALGQYYVSSRTGKN